MVEEGEEVQSQETELETEEEANPAQTDLSGLTDATSSQESSASLNEITCSQIESSRTQTGARCNPEATPAASDVTAAAAGPIAVPAEAHAPQDVTPAPQETK